MDNSRIFFASQKNKRLLETKENRLFDLFYLGSSKKKRQNAKKTFFVPTKQQQLGVKTDNLMK